MFRAAIDGGAWPLVVVGVVASAVAAFFYVRVVVLMFFSEPAADGPTVGVPGLPTTIVLAVTAAVTLVLGILPEPVLDLAEQARYLRRLMTGARAAVDGTPPSVGTADPLRRRLGPWLPEASWARHWPTAWTRRGGAAATSVGSAHPFVAEAARHLVDAGGKRFRPMLALLAAQFGDPTAPEVIGAGGRRAS